MKKINIAIIGAGLIGKKRAQAITKISKLKTYSVFDINQQTAKTFSKEFQCENESSIKNILNNPKIQLVILAIKHKDAALLAPKVLAKKHLLIEKPIGRNLKETKKIVNSAIKHKHHLFVGYNYHFYPHIQLAQKYIKNKKIGNIISSTFKIGHAASPGYEKTWKMDKELCGGGVIIDPGVHMIDLMLNLHGKPSKHYVQTSHLGWKKKVEDEAFILFNFKNKSTSLHHYSLNLAKNTLFIEIIGTKGIIRVNGRGGNYDNMTFNFTPRWFWHPNQKEKIVEKNFGDTDDSFYNELKFISNMINTKPKSQNYAKFLQTNSILNSLYGL